MEKQEFMSIPNMNKMNKHINKQSRMEGSCLQQNVMVC